MDLLHEQRAPAVRFSSSDLSQLPKRKINGDQSLQAAGDLTMHGRLLATAASSLLRADTSSFATAAGSWNSHGCHIVR